MTIFGKRLSEYVGFAGPFLALIFIAGIVRLALSMSGVPNSTTRWFSMTALTWIGVFYYSVRVHTSRFGSYKQLLVICALLNLVAQVIETSAIVLAILTGTNNIFTAPEYAFGMDGRTWFHAAQHLLIATTAGSLIPWIFGSAILAITRKLTGGDKKIQAARA